MLEFMYQLFIAPLEFLMGQVLQWGYAHTHSYGLSLILMSLVVNTVILPIYNKADGWQDEERAIRRRMKRREDMIRNTFKGQTRFVMLSTLYRQHGYSSLMTLRASVGFLLQVPFFFAAYHLLSHMDALRGQGFGPLADLGAPDGLLWGVNLMPVLMTCINLVSAFVYTKGLGTRDKVQLYGMAALFLVLLYDSPVALTFYWTLNNVYSLGKNIVEKDILPRFRNGAAPARGTGFFSFAVVALILYCCVGVYCATVRDAVPHKDMVLALFSMGIFGTAMSVVGRGRPAGFCASWPALIPLACCLPLLNTWHANVHMLSMEDILVSAAVLAVLLALVWLGGRMLMGLMANRWFRLPEPMFMAVFSLVASAALIFWSVPMIRLFTRTPRDFLYILLGLAVLLFVLARLCTIRRLNAFVLSLCVMLGCLVVTKNLALWNMPAQENAGEMTVDLKSKPNIYLYMLESYASLDRQETFWGCDIKDFRSFLDGNGFQTFGIFSNESYTLGSLYTIYTMNSMKSSNTELGVGDAVPMVREVNSGGIGNILLKYLRKNGYYIDLYYTNPRYFMFKKGKYIDKCNLVHKKSLFNYMIEHNYYTFLSTNRLCNESLFIKIHDIFFQKSMKEKYLIKEHVLNFIQNKYQKPYFTIFFGGSCHSNPVLYKFDINNQWKNTGEYQEKVKQSNIDIETIYRNIIQYDPDAIIILLGDHGPHNYRGVADRAALGDAKALLSHIGRSGVSYEEVVRDLFDVFFAVRMPHDKPLLTGGREITSCNIFRHIFATINDDPSILDGCPDNWSEINGVRVIRNGRLVPPEELVGR